MTEEQKLRKAEVARQNGAKSKGPVTVLGKHISSMNAIASGKHVETLEDDLPECVSLLSTDNRQAYVRLYQKHLRQYQPHSECELTLVRHMAIELFHIERLISLETHARQRSLDQVLRGYANLSAADQELIAYEIDLEKEKLWKSIRREKKEHQAAYAQYQKLLRTTRRDFALVPPEPVDLTVDETLTNGPLPAPEVVAEILDYVAKAQNEPSQKLPEWVVNCLLDEQLMAEIAPNLDVLELLDRLTAETQPRAA
jgi:hypothetical protein